MGECNCRFLNNYMYISNMIYSYSLFYFIFYSFHTFIHTLVIIIHFYYEKLKTMIKYLFYSTNRHTIESCEQHQPLWIQMILLPSRWSLIPVNVVSRFIFNKPSILSHLIGWLVSWVSATACTSFSCRIYVESLMYSLAEIITMLLSIFQNNYI